jgi:hypothetical protein
MLIENVQMFIDNETFKPKSRVTLVLDLESIQDSMLLPKEERAIKFLDTWETAYADYMKKMIGK